jgi:hypothetical membrane protein
MRSWTLASATVAPVALIGAWTWAAARQPPGFDPVRDTISALAAHGAADRWIMTAGLTGLGLAHLASALGLTEIGPTARALLAGGGAATLVVAARPQPDAGHVPAATVGFVLLALWPAVVAGPGRRVGRVVSAGLLALLGWLAIELDTGTGLGLSERVLAGAQSLVPLAAAIAIVAARRRADQQTASADGPGGSAPAEA